jgi:chemotaxis protein methyltransferase CheR
VKSEPADDDLFSPGTMRDAGLAISDAEFRYLRDLIYAHTGIALSDHKRALVCARLARRLRHWGFTTYTQYYELLTERDPEERELMELINAITTNKTDFFREMHHFQFLAEHVLPTLQLTHQRRVRIWSAACSTGEEPYSIAMTVCESLPLDKFDVKILASDIDTTVLERATAGVYPAEAVGRIPEALRARYFLRGSSANEGRARAKPILQSLIRFRRLNLIAESWPMQGPFDVIFCRNVLIYFDKETQRRLLQRFTELLRRDGYLMLGHAEAIHGFEKSLRTVGHSTYQRREDTA